MLLCVILLWPSKIKKKIHWFQCKICFEVWNFRTNWLKFLFLENRVKFKGFWKTFHLILMHFIHKILCFEELLHWNALFFKKLIFPKFRLIKPIARLIKIAIKNLVWICLTRLMLDRSNVIFDRSNLIFDYLKIVQRVFLKHKFFMCSSLFQTFSKTFWLSLSSTGPSQAEFCCFPSNFFKGFCLLAPVRPFYPSFFCLF